MSLLFLIYHNNQYFTGPILSGTRQRQTPPYYTECNIKYYKIYRQKLLQRLLILLILLISVSFFIAVCLYSDLGGLFVSRVDGSDRRAI